MWPSSEGQLENSGGPHLRVPSPALCPGGEDKMNESSGGFFLSLLTFLEGRDEPTKTANVRCRDNVVAFGALAGVRALAGAQGS